MLETITTGAHYDDPQIIYIKKEGEFALFIDPARDLSGSVPLLGRTAKQAIVAGYLENVGYRQLTSAEEATLQGEVDCMLTHNL